MDITKVCSKCKESKPLNNFHKQAATKDGYKYVCKTCSNAMALKHYHLSPEKYIARVRKHQTENKEHYRVYHNKYACNYRKTHPQARMRHQIANKIRKKLKPQGGKLRNSTNKFLGCSTKDFLAHLQSQFTAEMSWDNYGSFWNIDHVKPCSAFEPSIEGMRLCWHYTNLRPLKKEENFKKSNFYEGKRLVYSKKDGTPTQT